MEAPITILCEVRDPRDFNARHICASMLFISLIAALCGAKSSVAFADFAAANEGDLREFVDLPHGAPKHDSFSRLFRLLDPDEMAKTLAAFASALREGLGLDPPKGVVAIDGKCMRRGYERGRACMPPPMVSVRDAETRVSIAARFATGGHKDRGTRSVPDRHGGRGDAGGAQSLDLKGCIVILGS